MAPRLSSFYSALVALAGLVYRGYQGIRSYTWPRKEKMRTESGGMGKKRLVKDGMGMERKGTREANSNSSQQRSDINDTLGNHHTEFVHYIGRFGICYSLLSDTDI